MTHHGAGLRNLTQDDDLVKALKEDYRGADLSAADRAMLNFTTKLTREPWTMQRGDVETLKAAGFDDRAVLDIVQVTAYYAYVNRLADGLGVELEDFWALDDPDSGSE